METLFGIPLAGWPALTVWLVVMVVPWSYGLYMIRRLERSGVARWCGRPRADDLEREDRDR